MRPEELKRQEKELVRKEAEELCKGLNEKLQEGIKSNKITSQGGELEIATYKHEHLETIKKFFAKLGWDCDYVPRRDSWWSMTAQSENYYTRHFLVLRPKQKQKK